MTPAGFEIIAPVMMALRDETASLKPEVSDQRTATQRVVRSMEHAVTFKLDIDDIKKFIHELRNHERSNSDTNARNVAGPVLNRANESRRKPERITSGVQHNNGRSRHQLSHGQTNRQNNGPRLPVSEPMLMLLKVPKRKNVLGIRYVARTEEITTTK